LDLNSFDFRVGAWRIQANQHDCGKRFGQVEEEIHGSKTPVVPAVQRAYKRNQLVQGRKVAVDGWNKETEWNDSNWLGEIARIRGKIISGFEWMMSRKICSLDFIQELNR
jgi:hypothetical protein